MTGDAYFNLSTDQGSYCGYDFDGICWSMGHNPEQIVEMLNYGKSLADMLRDAQQRNDVGNTPKQEQIYDKNFAR